MVRHAFETGLLSVTLLCWIHYYYFSGKQFLKVFVYFSGSILIGQMSEAAAILFTEGYHYPGYWWYIGTVPLFVAVGWGYGLYLGYLLASQFSRKWENSKHYILIFAMCAGGAMVLIDLFAEVPAAIFELWPWEKGSAYYGVPLANFVGMFVFQATYNGTYKFIFTRSEWSRKKKVVSFYLALVPIFVITALSWLPFL